MNGKTGHRTVTPQSLRGEILAKSYRGLPDDMSYAQALKIIRRYVRGCANLTLRARLLMDAFIQLQAKSILDGNAEFDLLNDLPKFTVFARNAYLEGMLGMNRRSIQKGVAELREHVFIWCNDQPSRNRSQAHGICLLPAFARVTELQRESAEREVRETSIRFMQRQFSRLRIEIETIADLVDVEMRQELEMTKRACEQLRRSRELEHGMECLAKFTETIDRIKMAIATGSESKLESPSPDPADTPLTYKNNIPFKNVEPCEGAPGKLPADVTTTQDPRTVPVLGPSAHQLAKVLNSALALPSDHMLNQRRPPNDILAFYGRAAAAKIGLHRHTFLDLGRRFGDAGAALLLIQAAFDPIVRNPASWAASFLSKGDISLIDTRGSFLRWSRRYCATTIILPSAHQS